MDLSLGLDAWIASCHAFDDPSDSRTGPHTHARTRSRIEEGIEPKHQGGQAAAAPSSYMGMAPQKGQEEPLLGREEETKVRPGVGVQ